MKKITISLILISISLLSQAEVIYTDISDTTVTANGAQYNLDLDLNTVTDFIIDLSYPITQDHNQVTLIHRGANKGGGETVLNWLGKLAWGLNSGDPIGAGLSTWMTSGVGSPNEIFLAYYAGASMTGGAFINQESYLPLEFEIGSQTHYGWLRIAVNANSTEFTIKDFAYENVPNTPIAAGDNGETSGIDNLKNKSINLYPNPTPGPVHVLINESLPVSQINVRTPDGKLIYSYKYENISKQLFNIQMPEVKGVYFIEIRFEKNKHSIFKQILKI